MVVIVHFLKIVRCVVYADAFLASFRVKTVAKTSQYIIYHISYTICIYIYNISKLYWLEILGAKGYIEVEKLDPEMTGGL